MEEQFKPDQRGVADIDRLLRTARRRFYGVSDADIHGVGEFPVPEFVVRVRFGLADNQAAAVQQLLVDCGKFEP